jgi:hypothetical protein
VCLAGLAVKLIEKSATSFNETTFRALLLSYALSKIKSGRLDLHQRPRQFK